MIFPMIDHHGYLNAYVGARVTWITTDLHCLGCFVYLLLSSFEVRKGSGGL